MKPAMLPRTMPAKAPGAGPEFNPAYVVGMARMTFCCRLARPWWSPRGRKNTGSSTSCDRGVMAGGESAARARLDSRIVPRMMRANTDAKGVVDWEEEEEPRADKKFKVDDAVRETTVLMWSLDTIRLATVGGIVLTGARRACSRESVLRSCFLLFV